MVIASQTLPLAARLAAGLKTAGLKTAVHKTAVHKTAVHKTAVLKTAVHKTAVLKTAGLHTAVLRAAAAPPGGVPLIGRRAGQQLARHELARPIYQPSTWQRFLNWLGKLLNGAAFAIPGGWFGLIALAVVAVAVITGVVFWVRPARSHGRRSLGVIAEKPRLARDHRGDSVRLAAAGDLSGAIIERVRAIAAELEEREVIPPRPGRTADELAAEAGRQLPGLAGGLRSAMRLFDDVRYGDRPGSADGYALVSRVDDQVCAARAMAPQSAGSAGLAEGARR